MVPTLETSRLILRPFKPADTAAMFDMFSRPEAMRYMPTLPHKTIGETEQMLQLDLGRPGAHYWSICLKGSDHTLGHIHYLGQTRLPGMGYIIHPDYWNQGITTEACRAALKYGYEALGFDRVELWINEFNVASQRVAQKLGFKQRGQLAQKYPHESNHHTMFVYGQLASEWRKESVAPVEAARFFRVEPVLMVHDVTAAAEFYRDKLGFNIDFIFGDPADHAAVSRGEWSGAMVTIQLTRVPEERQLEGAGYLYILVDTELDNLCEQYRAAGVTIEREPTSYPWGMREFVIRDLFGHRLIFATHV